MFYSIFYYSLKHLSCSSELDVTLALLTNQKVYYILHVIQVIWYVKFYTNIILKLSKISIMEGSTDKKSIVVFKKIIEEINTKKMSYGDVIASESELSKKYNVGRGSIREALNALEALGIVKKQSGVGTIVENLSLDKIFNPANLLFELDYNNLYQVLEFREVFEQIVIKLIPGRIKKKDIEKLEEIIFLMQFYYDKNNTEKFSEFDYKFHQALAESTHNIVIINIQKIIYPFIKYILLQTVNMAEDLSETMDDHLELLKLIKSNDIKGANRIMKKHVERVKNFLIELDRKNKTKKSNK